METRIKVKLIPTNTRLLEENSHNSQFPQKLSNQPNQKNPTMVKNIKMQMEKSRQSRKRQPKKKKKKKKKIIGLNTPKNEKEEEDEDKDEDEDEEEEKVVENDFDNRVKNFMYCNKINPSARQSFNLDNKICGEVLLVKTNQCQITSKTEQVVIKRFGENTFVGIIFDKSGSGGSRKRKRKRKIEYEIVEEENFPVVIEPKKKKRKLQPVKLLTTQKNINVEFIDLKVKENLKNALNYLILKRCINFFSFKKENSKKKLSKKLNNETQKIVNYFTKIGILIPTTTKYAILFYNDERFLNYMMTQVFNKEKSLSQWKDRIFNKKQQSIKREFQYFAILREIMRKKILESLKRLHNDCENVLKLENLYIL